MSSRLKTIAMICCLVIGGLFFLSAAQPVLADQSLLNSQEGVAELKTVFGDNPRDIRITVVRLINVVLSLLGAVFIVLTIFGGFQYMTSGGNEEKTKKAVDILKAAIIGLIIILFAWSITRYSIVVLNKTAHNAVDYTWYQ